MHVELVSSPKGMYTDHRDGNKLNNTKANLRVCEGGQNVANSKLHSDSTTGFKGVTRIGKKFGAQGGRMNGKKTGKSRWLGSFDTAEDAARAYDEVMVKEFGEFARTNKSMGLLGEK